MALGRFGTLAVLRYNGFDLSSNETVLTTSYRVTPVYDQARRTVKWCEFEIGLKWHMHAESRNDPAVQDMIARLTKAGGELQYTGRGTGFEAPVNRGVVKDCDHGPRPGAINITTHGPLGVSVEWTVAFSIPSCADAVWSGIAEWNYSVSDSYDAERVATRTTSGRLVIANGRTAPGSRQTRDNAGAYLEDVWPPVGPDFELVDNDHQLSEDRSTLTYTQVIRERGAAPGLYILSQSGGESMVTAPNGAALVHTRRIQWKYTIRPDRSAKAAFDHFVPLVKDRLARAAKIPGADLLFAGFTADTGDPHKPRQQVTLSLSFQIVGARISEALGMSGMWQPIPNSNRRLWYATVEDVLGPRGKANLIFDPKADKIIDLCRRDDAPTAPPQPQPPRDTIIDLRNLPDLFPPPTPDGSWLKYDVALKTVIDAGNVVLKTLPEKELQQVELRSGPIDLAPQGGTAELASGPGPGARGGNGKFGDKGGWLAPDPLGDFLLPRTVRVGKPGAGGGGKPDAAFGGDDTVVQQRVTPTVYVNVTGRALRHGYAIPHPEVTSIDGHRAHLVTRGTPGEGFVTGVVGHNVYPVVGARFSLWYVVPGLSVAVTPGQPVPGR